MSSLCTFSTAYCIAICSVLIPSILLSTLATLYLLGSQHPQSQVRLAAALGLLCAVAIALHVLSWFFLGVVMAPTYILFFLAAIGMGLNLWAVTRPASLLRGLSFLRLSIHRRPSIGTQPR